MSRHKSWIVLVVAACLAIAAPSYADTDTINTVPSSSATFMTTLQTFLRDEGPQRDNMLLGGLVLEGGLGATAAGLAHTISAATGYPGGFFVGKESVSHTYTDTRRTFVYLRDDTDRTITIALATITYDTYLVFAEMAAGTALPSTPAGCIPLMQVDTSGGAIATVTDIRPGNVPAAAFSTLSDAVTAAANRTLVINEPWVLSANLTIPATVRVVVGRVGTGAIHHSTYTVTINGPLEAGAYRIFNGTGTVSFGEDACDFIRPEWWDDGSLGEGLLSAVTAIGTDTATLVISKWWDVSGNVVLFLHNTTVMFLPDSGITADLIDCTFYGPIIAPWTNRPIFSSAQTVTSAVSGWYYGGWISQGVTGWGLGGANTAPYKLAITGALYADSYGGTFAGTVDSDYPVNTPSKVLNLTSSTTIESGVSTHGTYIGNYGAVSEVTWYLQTAVYNETEKAGDTFDVSLDQDRSSGSTIWVLVYPGDQIINQPDFVAGNSGTGISYYYLSGVTGADGITFIAIADGVWKTKEYGTPETNSIE